MGKDAALGLGIPLQTYRVAESGASAPGKGLVRALLLRWGISEAFLHKGKPETPADRLALRIAKVLEQADASSTRSAAEYATRLRAMRDGAGFRSPGAAAKAMGWGAPIYTSHESNQNPITVERQVAYALAYGCRPEFAVLGRLPMRPQDPSEVEDNWKDLRAAGAVVAAPPIDAWEWLGGGDTGIPVLLVQRQRFRLSGQKLSIPLQQLSEFVASAGGRSFYAFQPSDDAASFYLIDPSGGTGRVVSSDASGSASVRTQKDPTPPSDPLISNSIEEPVRLGRLLARIVVKIELK